ncbi:unnamed protein product [Laminaria digitata]
MEFIYVFLGGDEIFLPKSAILLSYSSTRLRSREKNIYDFYIRLARDPARSCPTPTLHSFFVCDRLDLACPTRLDFIGRTRFCGCGTEALERCSHVHRKRGNKKRPSQPSP